MQYTITPWCSLSSTRLDRQGLPRDLFSWVPSMLRSEGLDTAALSFAFLPLWQVDAASAAAIAL